MSLLQYFGETPFFSPHISSFFLSVKTTHNKRYGEGKGTVHPVTGHEGPEGE
jgi:hypothetical protein